MQSFKFLVTLEKNWWAQNGRKVSWFKHVIRCEVMCGNKQWYICYDKVSKQFNILKLNIRNLKLSQQIEHIDSTVTHFVNQTLSKTEEEGTCSGADIYELITRSYSTKKVLV